MKINKAKIWREIGDAFATPYEERTRWQERITKAGLCWAFYEILGREYPLRKWGWLHKYSYRAICDLGFIMGLTSRWTFTDNERSMFAYFMAELGNKGYEELIEKCK